MLRALVLLAGACGRIGFADHADASGPLPAAPAPYASGTRLRAEYWEVDGARLFATWFDTELGEPCLVTTAADGVSRCLPNVAEINVEFSDPTCTTPLALGAFPIDETDCPSGHAYAYRKTGDVTRVFHVGPAFTGAVYQASGSCTAVSGSPYTFLDVGAEVPASAFVAIHEESTPAGDLAYVEQVGDDGSRLLLNKFDGARLARISHDQVLVVPDVPSAAVGFADASCAVPAVFVDGTASGRVLIERTHDLCTDAYDDATIGAEQATYYQLESGACTAATLPSNFHVYALLARTPLVPIATGAFESDGGFAHWRFDQGQTLPIGFYDPARGDECAPIALVTGHARVCAPIWDGAPSIYSDAGCTADTGGFPSCRGAWRSIWYPDAFGNQSCEGILKYVYTYDQPVPGPHYAEIDGTCTLVDATPLRQDASELPASAMLPVARAMD